MQTSKNRGICPLPLKTTFSRCKGKHQVTHLLPCLLLAPTHPDTLTLPAEAEPPHPLPQSYPASTMQTHPQTQWKPSEPANPWAADQESYQWYKPNETDLNKRTTSSKRSYQRHTQSSNPFARKSLLSKGITSACTRRPAMSPHTIAVVKAAPSPHHPHQPTATNQTQRPSISPPTPPLDPPSTATSPPTKRKYPPSPPSAAASLPVLTGA